MKLRHRTEDKYELEFDADEKDLLFHLLNLYPLVPESYHRLTKDKNLPHCEENQQLLNEALKAQRDQNKKEILGLINQSGRFVTEAGGSRAVFTRAELEWLLQVVNDVRVGNWLILGSPSGQKEKKLRLNPESMRHMMLMELAGVFEMFFLGVINGNVPAGDDD